MAGPKVVVKRLSVCLSLRENNYLENFTGPNCWTIILQTLVFSHILLCSKGFENI